jgi:hypothetical protein
MITSSTAAGRGSMMGGSALCKMVIQTHNKITGVLKRLYKDACQLDFGLLRNWKILSAPGCRSVLRSTVDATDAVPDLVDLVAVTFGSDESEATELLP